MTDDTFIDSPEYQMEAESIRFWELTHGYDMEAMLRLYQSSPETLTLQMRAERPLTTDSSTKRKTRKLLATMELEAHEAVQLARELLSYATGLETSQARQKHLDTLSRFMEAGQ